MFKNKVKAVAKSISLMLWGACSRVAFAIEDPDNPDLREITHPLFRVINVLVLSGGAVFVVLVLRVAVKFAMAQGDPKGIQGAKEALTQAIFGFIVVGGAFIILSIISGALGGAPYGSVSAVKASLEAHIGGLLVLIGYRE